MSKKLLINILKYTLSLILAIALLYYAFRGIPIEDVIEPFQQANYFWIFISALFGLVSHISRAIRWKMVLKPMGYQPSLYHASLALMVGYFINFIIPRGGEISRCGLIQKLGKVPMDKALGTVVLERLIDILMLLGLMVTLLIVEFQRVNGVLGDLVSKKLGGLENSLIYILVSIGLFIVLLFSIWKNRQRLQEFSFYEKIEGFIKNLLQGLLSIKDVSNPLAFILHSFLIWLMYYLMAYVLLFCFPETSHLSFWFGFMVLIMGAIGMALPVQGGLGTYHWLVSLVFIWHGFAQEKGLILATFMHTSQALVVLVFGGIAFLLSLFLINKN